MTAQQALAALIERRDLSRDDMLAVMRAIMHGEVAPPLIAAIVTALRMKGETITEIAAAATVMRELSARVAVRDDAHLVDTCGTGGDSAHTFNISTTAAFVAAAAGARVAKHGGRAVSSQSGSADVLELLGVNINLTPEQVGACINEVGLGFMFAPNHHSAMKHAAPVRRELGVRTIFNLLGPLTNPAGAPHQVMGVYHPDLVDVQARVLRELGSVHALIVHGREGLDEISIAGETLVGELKNGEVSHYSVTPEDFGLQRHALAEIKVADAAQSRDMVLAVLEGRHAAGCGIVALNAGASLYAAGLATTLAEGVARARDVIASGAARAKLQQLVDYTQGVVA